MSFDTVFDRVIGHEGGYVNDPNDHGGETKWGISKRSHPDIDIKNLSRDDAKDIYRADFWRPLHGDSMPDSVAFQVFDFAVNSGISTAIRHLQRSVGVADDGYWGQISQAALVAADSRVVVMRLLSSRLDFMTRLSGWSSFGKGWARRIAQNLTYASEDV